MLLTEQEVREERVNDSQVQLRPHLRRAWVDGGLSSFGKRRMPSINRKSCDKLALRDLGSGKATIFVGMLLPAVVLTG